MLKERMKALLAAVCCFVLLWGGVLPVWADDPTAPETEPTDTEAEPTDTETEPTDTETEPTDTETEPSDTETEPSVTETEPSDQERIRTFISLLIQGEELLISVTDDTGDPVQEAPLTLYLDGEIVTLTTDEEGAARYAMQERPIQISCTMPPFGGYESASSSVVLQPEELPTEGETDPEQTQTAPTSRRPTTTLGPTVTWTVRDPDEVTVTEIDTAATAAATEEPVLVTVAVEVNKYPRSTARMLIILGAALLAAAALIVYLFLAYAPRKTAEPEEDEDEPEGSGADEE